MFDTPITTYTEAYAAFSHAMAFLDAKKAIKPTYHPVINALANRLSAGATQEVAADITEALMPTSL